MPNHVTHICTVRGDCAAVFALAFSPATEKDGETDPGGFDCGKIIPQPECLKATTAGSYASMGLTLIGAGVTGKAFPQFGGFYESNPEVARERFDAYTKEEQDECVRQTLLSAEALIRCGYRDWYEWCTANWGTKWGAYSQEWEEPAPGATEWTFKFESAWSPPEPVFEKLATLLPEDTVIDVQWQDEGGPTGAYLIADGECQTRESTYPWPTYEDEEEDA